MTEKLLTGTLSFNTNKQSVPSRNIHFQLKENGNSLGFNLVADIVSEVNWGKVMQWYEAYHPPEVKSEFERCLLLLFIQAFTEKKHVEVL